MGKGAERIRIIHGNKTYFRLTKCIMGFRVVELRGERGRKGAKGGERREMHSARKGKKGERYWHTRLGISFRG
jgi:hypothetical protein